MLSIQITTRDIPISPALDQHIRKRAEKLTRFYDKITCCKVVLEFEQKNKHQGKLFHLCIDVSVPGKELVVNNKSDIDVYIAIRDAFDAMERQIEEHSRKRHGRVKTHEDVLHGRIARIISDEGYGFIEGDDGTEYYFSVTNVSHPDFTQLSIGDTVGYLAQPVSEGWQAHHVIRERQNNIEEANEL